MPETPARSRSPHRRTRRALVALALALLVAAPAAAEVYFIELADGNRFESRYQPEEASWDNDMLLLLTEYGTWIALPKAEVASITTDTESKGFGTVVDTTTVILGFAANDAPAPGDETQLSEVDRLQQLIQSQQPQNFTVEQFVEPGQAGGTTGGLPALGAQGSTINYVGGLGGTPAPPND